MYKLVLMPPSKRVYERLDLEIQKRIDDTLESLEENPFSYGTQKMKSQKSRYYRRVGIFRILFEVDKKEKICTIVAIEKRDKAYRNR